MEKNQRNFAHFDLQELCFKCPILMKKIVIDEEYDSIFCSTITKNIARILVKIDQIRKVE